MKIEEARQRIESAMTQYGAHAGVAIDLIISEVKSGCHDGIRTLDIFAAIFSFPICINSRS